MPRKGTKPPENAALSEFIFLKEIFHRVRDWNDLLVRLKEGSIKARGRIFYDDNGDRDEEDPLGGIGEISPTTWRDHDLDRKFWCLCKPNQVHSIYEIEFNRGIVSPYLKRGGGGTQSRYPWEACAMELRKFLNGKAVWPSKPTAQAKIILGFVVWDRTGKIPEESTIRGRLRRLIDLARE